MAERFVRIEEVVGSIPIISTPGQRCSSPPNVAKLCHHRYDDGVATMNVSIPDDLKSFVETQVATEGYGTSSEYVRELIRRDRQRNQLRRLILDGLAVGTSHPVDDAFWATLRQRIGSATP